MRRYLLGVFITYVCCGTPPTVIEAAPPEAGQPAEPSSGQPYVLYSQEGRVWAAQGALVGTELRGDELDPKRTSFWLKSSDAVGAVHDADEVVIRTADAHELALALAIDGRVAALVARSPMPATWTVERAAGPGGLALGERFTLRASDGRVLLEAGSHKLTLSSDAADADFWTLGCQLEIGANTSQWSDAMMLKVASGARATATARAVGWLQDHARRVRLPTGDFSLIVWDDPTLQPAPTVAYLMTDTLWASKALQPYDPSLSDELRGALLSLGWYGNGLADTLFHGVSEPAHRPASSDVVHGTELGLCLLDPDRDGATHTVQLRVPEVVIDPAWTAGNSSQFIDSVVYTALNEFWGGERAAGRSRLQEAITDSRAAGPDSMFWDAERSILVDQASRCEYDSNTAQCSAQCTTCVPCTGTTCRVSHAGAKLGLVLYAARLMGVDQDPALSATLARMQTRLWEAQLSDGGVPHAAHYAPDGAFVNASAATGEATAIAILAESVAPQADLR